MAHDRDVTAKVRRRLCEERKMFSIELPCGGTALNILKSTAL